jgi:hypothetical protein
MTVNIPVFCDCEASGLEGAPIEVGWAFINADTGSIESEGHLIRPPLDWAIEENWDFVAEALHGISLHQLRTQGRPVWEVADRMNHVLAGRELYSDSPLDEIWVMRIFDEAGVDPAFTFRRTDAEVLISSAAAARNLDAGAYERAKQQAERNAPRRHRAESDARHLASLWAAITLAE